MKRKIILVFTLIICAMFVTSCSCKKKDNLEYKYVGAYIEVVKVEKRTMDDRNIKLYYDEIKDSLVDTNKIYEYQITAGTLTKDIKDNAYDLSGSYSISAPKSADLKEIYIYPITFDGINYKILEDKKTIKLVDNETNGTSFKTSYFFDDEEHTFKISIKNWLLGWWSLTGIIANINSLNEKLLYPVTTNVK